jgi:predicted TPR repeat methyltransferase
MAHGSDRIAEAIARAQRGDFAKARTLARDLGRIPVSHPGLLALATAAFNGGDALLALRFLDRAAVSGSPDAHYGRGAVLASLGRNSEASEALARCLAIRPDHALALTNMGALHQLAGQMADAEQAYRRAIAAAPTDAVALDNLAGLYLGSGRLAEAEEYARRALAIKPTVEIHLRLADILCAEGRFDEGEATLLAGLSRAPQVGRLWRALGHARKSIGRTADAVAAFTTALDVDPGDGESRHMIDSLKGVNSPRAPVDYVRGLFDSYADRFEDHLVNKVNYSAPARLRELYGRVADGQPLGAVADLGCGTGLTADAFADVSGRLIGIDLAPRMLQLAAARGVYAELHQGEVADVLCTMRELSAVIATDLFIYIGDLDQIFGATTGALLPDGWFLFSVEAIEGDGWQLLPTGRYAQSRRYIERLAANNGFVVAACERGPLRGSRDGDIIGDYWVLRQKGSPKA